MRIFTVAAISALALTLAACGGRGDDQLGEEAQEAMENRADLIDLGAQSQPGVAKVLAEAHADAVREEGDAKEKAIDGADLNADKLTPEQRRAIVDPK